MEVSTFSFRKSCLAGAIALALLTGCGGGGGSKGGGGNSGGGDGAQPVAMSGTAIKGIIKNGVVNLYGVDSNGVRQSTALATGRTGSDGRYALQVSGYSGPVVVEITADSESLMVCDIPGTDSCDTGVDFGDEYALGSGFSLKAVVPQVSSGGTVTANVTALTDLAAALAETSGITADSAHIANTQVGDLFGLTADITTLAAVDVTDPVALAAASVTERTAALLSAAILAAAVNDGNSIEDALAAVAENFVANNGQLINNEAGNTSTTTLAEILQQAQALVESDDLSEVDLGAVVSNISADLATAENSTPGSVTEAQPNEELLSDGFSKARALVQDLRDIATAATFDDIRDGATEFSDRLDVVAELIDADTQRIVNIVSLVAGAIAEAAEAEAADGIYSSEDGIDVTVATVAGVTTYSVENQFIVLEGETARTIDVDLTGSGVFTVVEDVVTDEGESSWSETVDTSITVDFAIQGVAQSDAVSLAISEGSNVLVEQFEESWESTEGDSSSADSGSGSAASIGFELDVVLTQLGGDNPVTFTGGLAMNVEGYSYSNAYEDQFYSCEIVNELEECSASYSESSTTNFDRFTTALSGEFSQGTDSFSAAFNLTAVNNGYELSESSSWNHFWREGSDSENSYDDSSSDETANQFVRVNFTLDLEAMLPGIADEVAVRLTGDRNALRTGTAALELAYDGKRINADLALTGAEDARAAELTITNQAGTTLVWTDSNIDDENDVIEGVISANGAQQAAFSEENGVAIIRYNGGYTESF